MCGSLFGVVCGTGLVVVYDVTNVYFESAPSSLLEGSFKHKLQTFKLITTSKQQSPNPTDAVQIVVDISSPASDILLQQGTPLRSIDYNVETISQSH